MIFLASKKASNPRTRIKGLIIATIGCSILGTFGFLINAFGVMTTQIGVIIINIFGIINCKKEIKKQEMEKCITYNKCKYNEKMICIFWNKKKEKEPTNKFCGWCLENNKTN